MDIVPVGMQHGLGDPFARVAIDGDDNACVDFRYAADPRLRWWFDHHATAFQPPSLRDDFAARRDERMAFDPQAPSCTGLIARALGERFGWQVPAHLTDLVQWADVIDAAAYPSAASAVALELPAQRLALWVSTNRDPAAQARYIDELSRRGLAEVDGEPWIGSALAPVVARRTADREAWRALGQRHGRVVFFDIIGREVGAPGFHGYDLFPDCTYTVTVGRTATAVKVGVGFNPWGRERLDRDLGELCQRHGGGGHAAVGGVTLPVDDVDHGRAVAAAIIADLTAGF